MTITLRVHHLRVIKFLHWADTEAKKDIYDPEFIVVPKSSILNHKIKEIYSSMKQDPETRLVKLTDSGDDICYHCDLFSCPYKKAESKDRLLANHYGLVIGKTYSLKEILEKSKGKI